MMQRAKMGSMWMFSDPEFPQDNGIAMLCQVDYNKYAMIIGSGSGKGNRWNDPVHIKPINGILNFTESQWEGVIGTNYIFTEIKE